MSVKLTATCSDRVSGTLFVKRTKFLLHVNVPIHSHTKSVQNTFVTMSCRFHRHIRRDGRKEGEGGRGESLGLGRNATKVQQTYIWIINTADNCFGSIENEECS